MMAKIEEKLDRNRLLSSVKKYATVNHRRCVSFVVDWTHRSILGVGSSSREQSGLSEEIGTSNFDFEFQRNFTRLLRGRSKILLSHRSIDRSRWLWRCSIGFMPQPWNISIDIRKNRRISPLNNWKIWKNFFWKFNKNRSARVFTKNRRCNSKDVRRKIVVSMLRFSPPDAHSSHLIPPMYFPNRSVEEPWLNLYDQCVWLAVEGLYIVIARYNRHYRALYRLAHFFHSNEFYRHHRLSLELFLGGPVLELKNYPKIIGLYQERSKHNLFNVSNVSFRLEIRWSFDFQGIWRIQPLEAERVGSFNASMYKCTRLFIELLLHFEEQWNLLVEVLRQLMEKPEIEK